MKDRRNLNSAEEQPPADRTPAPLGTKAKLPRGHTKTPAFLSALPETPAPDPTPAERAATRQRPPLGDWPEWLKAEHQDEVQRWDELGGLALDLYAACDAGDEERRRALCESIRSIGAILDAYEAGRELSEAPSPAPSMLIHHGPAEGVARG